MGIIFGNKDTELLKERILRIASLLDIEFTGFKLHATCEEEESMSIFPYIKEIDFCPDTLKDIPDDALAFIIAHEASHADEALATINAAKFLMNKYPEESIKRELTIWYEFYKREYIAHPGIAHKKYVERIKDYLDGRETLETM